MDKIQILSKCELFNDLTDEQLDTVASKCSVEVFEPGAIICKQDTKQEKVYVVAEGLAGIILEVGPLSQRQVQAATPGEVVSWSGMIEPNIATATVKALEKTTLLAFNGEELCKMCRIDPEIGCPTCKAVARIVANRLRQAYTQLLGVTAQD